MLDEAIRKVRLDLESRTAAHVPVRSEERADRLQLASMLLAAEALALRIDLRERTLDQRPVAA